jgi:glycosyltransferase involved in cell wall biosynthesis
VRAWLAFGTYDVRRHPRMGVLVEGLRARGERVTELNEPLDLSTADRVRLLRQPWRLPVPAVRLARSWFRLAGRARRELRRARPDAVLVGYLGHFDVRLARRLFGRVPVVLDHLVSAAGTAADRGLTGPVRDMGLRWIDRGALASADLVVVDTVEHAQALPAPARPRAVVVPVGASQAWFDAGQAVDPDRSTTPLRVVFVGVYTPLHGSLTIGAALGLLAGDDRFAFTMIGTGQDHAGCRALAAANHRVTWLDWVPATELPALVAAHQVCLGIFGTTDKARRVVPNKVFQGLAAGCAVVTSDTPPQHEALAGAALLVPPGRPEAIAQALRRLADDPAELADRQARGRALAEHRYRPAAVVEPLLARLDQLTAPIR